MPLNIDTSRPGTLQQLQYLYTGDPNTTPEEVQGALQTRAPQGADWVHQTEMKYGINDASRMFQDQQINQQMARFAANQGAPQQPQYQSDYQRIAAQAQQVAPVQTGMGGPNNRYGFQPTLNARRDAMTPEERAVDSLRPNTAQNQIDPYANLTQFDRQQIQQTGQTPDSLIMQRRLGEQNRYFTDASGNKRDWINPTAKGRYTPEQLYTTPEFRSIYQQDPAKAAHAFEALTGQPLQAYEGVRTATQKQQIDREKQYEKTFYDKAVSGEVRMNSMGEWESEEFTIDPLTGKKIPSGKWSAVSGTMKEIASIGDRAFPELKRKALLEAKARQEAETKTSPTVPVNPRDPNSPIPVEKFNRPANPIWQVAQNAVEDKFNPNANSQMMNFSRMGQIEHQRGNLVNDPQFKALYAKNPALAMARVVALQKQNQNQFDSRDTEVIYR
jgi:hypothetical protein